MTRRVIIGLAFPLLAWGLSGCFSPPQMGADREAFKAVDALYTAVSLRDAGKVDQCAAKLKALHDAGKMPDSAYSSLESIIAVAKDEKWDRAVERLGTFMEGQRR